MELTPSAPNAQPGKRDFDIPEMLGRIERAVSTYPKAMLFELAERGYDSIFDQLIACLISVRTLDEVSLPASLRLLEKVRSAQELSELSLQQIDRLIRPATYHGQKAARLKSLAGLLVREYEGRVPREYERLVELPGVGPKCASLTLGIACHRPLIGVDVHVHRVTNRWGLVRTATPEKTAKALVDLFSKALLDPTERDSDAVWKAHLPRTQAHVRAVPGA